MSERWAPASILDVVDAAAIPAALVVATFLAASPWLRAFAVPGTTVLLVLAAIGSVSIPVLAIRVWRQPPAVSYAASALGLVVLLLGAAGLHPGALWHGLLDGPNRLLTETLPLTGSRAGLAAPLVLTWFCGTAAAELVTRSKGWPSGIAAAGLALPVACFVLAYAVTAPRPGRDLIAAALLLFGLGLVAVARNVAALAAAPQAVVGTSVADEARPSMWRPGASGAAVALLIAVTLALVVPSLPSMSRPPAALNRPAPLAAAVIIDPVDALADLRDGRATAPARPVLGVDTDAPSNGYLAMAVLDAYDGATWTFDSTFHPTGGRVPAAPVGAAAASAGAGLATVRQEVDQAAPLPIPLLPALDRPLQVDGVDVAADAATGMLLPITSIDRASYTVVSRGPVATLATVLPADGIGVAAGLPPTTSSDLTLPAGTSTAMATALRYLATLTGRRPAPTVAFLQAVMTSLHAHDFRVDPSLPAPPQKKRPTSRSASTTVPLTPGATTSSGTSLSQVINAVTNEHRGTPEQFATLYAMVARYLGVPARLVSGFRLAPGSDAGPVAAGAHQVTNRQAWTWAEVPVAGLGWVVADPTPDATIAVSAPPPTPAQATATTLAPPQANAVPRNQAAGHAVAKPAAVKVPHSHPVPWWLVALAVVAGGLLLAGLLGPGLAGVRRVLRRRARYGADPSHLAVGAWLELLDGLQQAGMATGPSATSGEVATEAGLHFGPDVTESVHQVGAVADRAVCSPLSPPDEEAAQARLGRATVAAPDGASRPGSPPARPGAPGRRRGSTPALYRPAAGRPAPDPVRVGSASWFDARTGRRIRPSCPVIATWRRSAAGPSPPCTAPPRKTPAGTSPSRSSRSTPSIRT